MQKKKKTHLNVQLPAEIYFPFVRVGKFIVTIKSKWDVGKIYF